MFVCSRVEFSKFKKICVLYFLLKFYDLSNGKVFAISVHYDIFLFLVVYGDIFNNNRFFWNCLYLTLNCLRSSVLVSLERINAETKCDKSKSKSKYHAQYFCKTLPFERKKQKRNKNNTKKGNIKPISFKNIFAKNNCTKKSNKAKKQYSEVYNSFFFATAVIHTKIISHFGCFSNNLIMFVAFVQNIYI